MPSAPTHDPSSLTLSLRELLPAPTTPALLSTTGSFVQIMSLMSPQNTHQQFDAWVSNHSFRPTLLRKAARFRR